MDQLSCARVSQNTRRSTRVSSQLDFGDTDNRCSFLCCGRRTYPPKCDDAHKRAPCCRCRRRAGPLSLPLAKGKEGIRHCEAQASDSRTARSLRPRRSASLIGSRHVRMYDHFPAGGIATRHTADRARDPSRTSTAQHTVPGPDRRRHLHWKGIRHGTERPGRRQRAVPTGNWQNDGATRPAIIYESNRRRDRAVASSTSPVLYKHC